MKFVDLSAGKSLNQGIARCQHLAISSLRPLSLIKRGTLPPGCQHSEDQWSRCISTFVSLFSALCSPHSALVSAVFGFLAQCLWIITLLNNSPVFSPDLPLPCLWQHLAPPSPGPLGLRQGAPWLMCLPCCGHLRLWLSLYSLGHSHSRMSFPSFKTLVEITCLLTLPLFFFFLSLENL